MPAGFQSGSNILLGTGSDGSTAFGTNIFTSDSADFVQLNQRLSGALPQKYLTLWREDDPTDDDSVYRILGVTDPNTLLVDVQTGGSTRLGGKSVFGDRSNIKYRITDIVSASQFLAWSTDHWLVMNLESAPNVNQGQLVSQIRLDLTESQARIQIQVSPSGSWNGSSFTDASSIVSQSWFNSTYTNGCGRFLFLGGRDFLICSLKGIGTAWGASAVSPLNQPGFHIEVPRRLYPQQNDPNPLAWTMWQDSSGLQGVSPVTGSYAGGFLMACDDGTTRSWITRARCPSAVGDHFNYAITAASGGLYAAFDNGRSYGLGHYNAFSSSYLTTDAVLMQTGSATDRRYVTSRVKLRRVRFTGPNVPPNTRLGEYWVHIGGGAMWPWDGSEVPFGLFPNGGGGMGGSYEPG